MKTNHIYRVIIIASVSDTDEINSISQVYGWGENPISTPLYSNSGEVTHYMCSTSATETFRMLCEATAKSDPNHVLSRLMFSDYIPYAESTPALASDFIAQQGLTLTPTTDTDTTWK